MKVLKVTCPTCKKTFSYYDSNFRPFCCEKCRLVDLGHWLTESYAVPVEKLTEDELETLEHILNEKNKEDGNEAQDSEDGEE